MFVEEIGTVVAFVAVVAVEVMVLLKISLESIATVVHVAQVNNCWPYQY